MSRETLEWLNTNTLIGWTSKRGNAWHYRAEEQGEETNHYADAVPVTDVMRRLFDWEPISAPVSATFDTANGPVTITDDTRQVIARNDTLAPLGVFKNSYQPHGYSEWLIDVTSRIVDDALNIGSAGLLKGGAVGWLQIETPDNFMTPEGVSYRPHILAATSLDGSLATTYKGTVTNVVCDNTMECGLGEKGNTFKVKHSKYSNAKIADAREALGFVFDIADDFAAEVKALCETSVSGKQFNSFMTEFVPVPEDDGRAKTVATDKHDRMVAMWLNDNRVSPWAGNAFGVLQLVNTYSQHETRVNAGTNRGERNIFGAATGKLFEPDRLALDTLGKILSNV